MTNQKEMENYIEEFKQANYESFDIFYHATNKQVYVFVYNILRNRELSEDVLQETYMRFLNNINKYKKNTNYFNFLITIAKNLAINEYNRHKRILLDEERIEALQDEERTDEPMIFHYLDYLKEDEREIVILHLIDNLKFKEISNLKNEPLGTILWRYNKAIKKLKQKIEVEK